jgi:hypothetical protein
MGWWAGTAWLRKWTSRGYSKSESFRKTFDNFHFNFWILNTSSTQNKRRVFARIDVNWRILFLNPKPLLGQENLFRGVGMFSFSAAAHSSLGGIKTFLSETAFPVFKHFFCILWALWCLWYHVTKLKQSFYLQLYLSSYPLHLVTLQKYYTRFNYFK